MASPVDCVLTPSERVLLNGTAFAKRALTGNVTLTPGGEQVSAAELGQAMLCAALLGLEQAGAIRLETGQRKGFLGLGRVELLFAEPLAQEAAWPDPSIERSIVELAVRRRSHNAHEVDEIVEALLGENSPSPWRTLEWMVKERLVKRGLLRAVEERKLKVFKRTRYELPDETAAQLQREPIAPLQQLLESCQGKRPQVWKLLRRNLDRAVSVRTEQSQPDFD